MLFHGSKMDPLVKLLVKNWDFSVLPKFLVYNFVNRGLKYREITDGNRCLPVLLSLTSICSE